MKYQINNNGYYGEYGGAYIPELLHQNLKELEIEYRKIKNDESFKKDYLNLLKDYAGRPSPLYHAKKLSEKYNTNIYLKREDLNHTGSHKINNTIGQILLAKRMQKKRIIAETGAGQHGVATATVCALFGLECIVYMGAIDMERITACCRFPVRQAWDNRLDEVLETDCCQNRYSEYGSDRGISGEGAIFQHSCWNSQSSITPPARRSGQEWDRETRCPPARRFSVFGWKLEGWS